MLDLESLPGRPRTANLHAAQLAFRHSNALYRGFVGGRGAGKTWIGAYDLLRRVQPGKTYLVASPTYTILEDTTLVTFTGLAKDWGTWRGLKASPRPNVRLAQGVTVRFRSAEEPDKLRGPNLSGVWLDEASQMHEDAYKIAIACLREQGEQGWLSATFTPKGLTHWTYEVFGKKPLRPHTELFHAKTADNPFNPPEFAATLAEQYAGQWARQELGGEFVAAERLQIAATGLYRRIKRNKEIADAVEHARGKAVDLAETALKAAVLRGEAWAVCFMLKCLGKDRGYVERAEHTGLEGEPVCLEIVEEIIDAHPPPADLIARRPNGVPPQQGGG
jgi:phage terminase large subunit-like protein